MSEKNRLGRFSFSTATGSLLLALASVPASADPIHVVNYPDNFGGPVTCLGAGSSTGSMMAGPADCDAAGGYVMTPLGDDPNAAGSMVTSVGLPGGGSMNFHEQGPDLQTTGNPLSMIVGDPGSGSSNPDDWWQYGDHSSVYMTGVNWIELVFDTTSPVRAISFFVGASFTGAGWIQAFDENNNATSRNYFSLASGDTPGFGVYSSPGSCSSISRVIVEPSMLWGVGNFATNQGACQPVKVPEPGTLALFGIGLFALAISTRNRRRQIHA